MDPRLQRLAAIAAQQHGMFSIDDAREVGVSDAWRSRLVIGGLIERLGPRSFAFAGGVTTWTVQVHAGLADLGPRALLTGRSAATLLGLDGFEQGTLEFLVPRSLRNRSTRGIVHSTTRRLAPADRLDIATVPVVAASRLIIDGARYGWTERELEDAVDSAIRLGWTSSAYLRSRFASARGVGLAGGVVLARVLGVAGVESRLERDFVRLIRRVGLPEPELQVVHRADGLTTARVDARFGETIVELAGHGTHATRRQRQRDAQRHTELTLAGFRVLTFTYEDVRERPAWVLDRLQRALLLTAPAA